MAMIHCCLLMLVCLAGAPAEKPPAESAEATGLPEWVDRPGERQGTVYREAVKSGLFVTSAECEQAIEPKLRSAINEYIDEYLMPGAAAKVTIDDALLNRLRKETYLQTVQSATVGPMRQLHVLLEFDDQARSELTRRWHQTMVNTRLVRLALICGTVLGLLAVATAYLKLDLRTAGQVRGRLKLGAAAAILLVLAAAAVVRRTLLN